MNDSIRVRFAPSPTGHLHIGNARTAILNWLFARHSGGTFILRIEDTDMERSTKESELSIYEDLNWLKLDWNEGPEAGGDYGPYRQSERLEIYRHHAMQLVELRRAYFCFCSEEELESKRQARKAGSVEVPAHRCLDLTPAEQQKRRKSGIEPVIRFHVPDRDTVVSDLVLGDMMFPANTYEDFVLLRSDGVPTYNFAAAVDDHLMRISHVVRGNDHVSNTPKQIMIYEALGWPLPQFAHIPMILGEDRTRLSKRHGATSLEQFSQNGYLPEALINFLSLLSWSSESGDEVLSVERLIKEFDLSRVNKSPAIFDNTKLNWMNGVYIRQLTPAQLCDACLPFLEQSGVTLPPRDVLTRMLAVVHNSLETLAQAPQKLELFWVDRIHLTDGAAIAMSQTEAAEKVYWSFLRQLDHYETLDADTFRKIMKTVNNETGVMGKELWMPIRIAITGTMHGPDLPAVVEILGKDKVRNRILQLVE